MCVLAFFGILATIIIATAARVNFAAWKGVIIMFKNFEVKPYLFPMPTYMIGTYNEDDSVDVMMMAWGGICAEDMVALNLEAEHKTVTNLETRKAFTLAVPGTDTLRESDFFGIATSNKMVDKFERSGLHAIKSENVDAPIITEYPSPWNVRLWKCRRSRMDCVFSAKSSTWLRMRRYWTKTEKSMPESSMHSPLIRCRMVIMRLEKKSARHGTAERI